MDSCYYILRHELKFLVFFQTLKQQNEGQGNKVFDRNHELIMLKKEKDETVAELEV